jgi:chemotaxis protein histidine kinase CheA
LQRIGQFQSAGGATATRESLYEVLRQQQPWATSAARFGGIAEDLDKWQKLQQAKDAAESAWKQAPGEEARKKVAADAAGHDADRTAKRAEENEKFAADEARDLEERRRRLTDRQQANQELSQTERDNNKLKTPFGALASQDAAQAEATGLAIERHKPVGAQAEEQLKEVGTAIAGHNVSLETAVQMMHWARQNNETVVTTATRLADAMLSLVGQHSALKGKVAMIEGELAQVAQITHRLPGN